jgi:hypothetical protein
LNDHTVDAPPFPEALSAKPPVRTVAVWSQRDGVIAPECARGEIGEADRAEEMHARHLEMTCSRRAVKQIIDVLQSEIAE